MRALVVYESMYGNTRQIADAIGAGLATAYRVDVVPVSQATPWSLDGADLVVVGGPTHVHGISRPSTRHAAAVDAAKPGSELTLDPDAEGLGVREWFDTLRATPPARAAAFDTRIEVSVMLSGRASKGIARRLRRHGSELVAEPESFLVTKQNTLVPGETDRAREWGRQLVHTPAPSR